MDKLDHPIYTLVSLLVKTHKPLDPEEAQNQLTCLNRASYLCNEPIGYSIQLKF